MELLDVPVEARAGLIDPGRVDETCGALSDARTAAFAHACTHLTMSPNVVHGGEKTNIIPDTVDIDVDIRTLAGQNRTDVEHCLAEALGDLWPTVSWSPYRESEASESHLATPLGDSITKVGRAYRPVSYTHLMLTRSLGGLVPGCSSSCFSSRAGVLTGPRPPGVSPR